MAMNTQSLMAVTCHLVNEPGPFALPGHQEY
jgi:hypothetical protein